MSMVVEFSGYSFQLLNDSDPIGKTTQASHTKETQGYIEVLIYSRNPTKNLESPKVMRERKCECLSGRVCLSGHSFVKIRK